MASLTTIEVTADLLTYKTWLRTSYIAISSNNPGGGLIENMLELGIDQEDAFNELFYHAAREVLKLFASRQGNVASSSAFIYTSGTSVKYGYYENEPVLVNAGTFKEMLDSFTKEALYCFIASEWFIIKKQPDLAQIMAVKYEGLARSIERTLYKLVD